MGSAYSYELEEKRAGNCVSLGTSPAHMQLPMGIKAAYTSLHL